MNFWIRRDGRKWERGRYGGRKETARRGKLAKGRCRKKGEREMKKKEEGAILKR